jgi:hypothetical protein
MFRPRLLPLFCLLSVAVFLPPLATVKAELPAGAVIITCVGSDGGPIIVSQTEDTLNITSPDGSPLPAEVMCTISDGSTTTEEGDKTNAPAEDEDAGADEDAGVDPDVDEDVVVDLGQAREDPDPACQLCPGGRDAPLGDLHPRIRSYCTYLDQTLNPFGKCDDVWEDAKSRGSEFVRTIDFEPAAYCGCSDGPGVCSLCLAGDGIHKDFKDFVVEGYTCTEWERMALSTTDSDYCHLTVRDKVRPICCQYEVDLCHLCPWNQQPIDLGLSFSDGKKMTTCGALDKEVKRHVPDDARCREIAESVAPDLCCPEYDPDDFSNDPHQ